MNRFPNKGTLMPVQVTDRALAVHTSALRAWFLGTGSPICEVSLKCLPPRGPYGPALGSWEEFQGSSLFVPGTACQAVSSLSSPDPQHLYEENILHILLKQPGAFVNVSKMQRVNISLLK